VEDLIAGTRDLSHHWAGDAAQAVLERNRQLQLEIGNAHRYCSQIAATLRGFADNIGHFQRMLHAVVAEAESQGLRVDLTGGRITAPPSAEAGAAAVQARVDVYVQRIEEIVAQAAAADTEARRIIENNQVGAYERPDAALDPVAPDFLALAGVSPERKAETWADLHQLNRDRLIQEHPELVGPAVGLPSDARDQANRLLLTRARSELLARRDRLDVAQDGAGSRAVTDVDARLAELAEAERQVAAAPGQRLLGYSPVVLADGDSKWDGYVPPAIR
jgi:hypothetical protein